MTRPGRAVVIGVGNPDRGDDAAGLLVARHLRDGRGERSLGHRLSPIGRPLRPSRPPSRLLRRVAVREAPSGGLSVLAMWERADAAIIVDAVSTGARAGAIVRFDVSTRPLPVTCRTRTSHALSVGEVIELARTLRRLPPRLVVYGIEGAQYALGAAPSPAVVRAVRTVARRIRQELQAVSAGTP